MTLLVFKMATQRLSFLIQWPIEVCVLLSTSPTFPEDTNVIPEEDGVRGKS